MRASRSLSLVAVAAATLALSACSPPVAGLLGLEVRDGRLILLAQSCDVAIVDVWITGDDAADGFLERERVIVDGVAEGLAEHDLGPVEEFAASLDPDVVYSIRGWAQGSSGRAPGPAIRVDDLEGWGDGVLFPGDDGPLDHAVDSREAFAAAACG